MNTHRVIWERHKKEKKKTKKKKEFETQNRFAKRAAVIHSQTLTVQSCFSMEKCKTDENVNDDDGNDMLFKGTTKFQKFSLEFV